MNLTLIDASNRRADVRLTAANEPALALPPGRLDVSSFRWLGHAYLASVRVPLAQFEGIDLSQVTSMEIQPATDPSTSSGQATSGSLFIADIEFIR
jgi:hypothetical protein